MNQVTKSNNLYGFSPHLFWDVDPAKFDIDRNDAWIVQRVLEYGNMEDWKIIEDYFGVDKIVSLALNFRSLDPVARSFLCFLSGKKKEDFRCYRIAQLYPTPWNS